MKNVKQKFKGAKNYRKDAFQELNKIFKHKIDTTKRLANSPIWQGIIDNLPRDKEDVVRPEGTEVT